MNLKVEKQILQTKKELKSEMHEYAVDCELVLPDYCGDIARVLKCKGQPRVTEKRITNGTLVLEGTVQVNLLYVDDKGEVGCYQQNLPLYYETPVMEDTDCIAVATKMDYCNCRVMSSRKVELHGAVSMRVTMEHEKKLFLITQIQGEGIETLETQETLTTLEGTYEKTVTINDELQIASGSIRSILRSSCVVTNQEIRVLAGKVVVKGDLEVVAFYQNTDGGFDTLRGQIPFSHIFDVDGVDEQTDCLLQYEVNTLELRTRTGLDGECKNVAVTIGLTALLDATKTFVTPLVTDGYCTRHGLDLHYHGEPLVRLCQTVEQTDFCKLQLGLEKDIATVLDLWCDLSVERIMVTDQQLCVAGVLTAMILTKDQDGGLAYFEKSLDYRWQYPVEQANVIIRNAKIEIQNMTYTLVGEGKMELRGQIRIGAQLYQQLTCSAVSEVTVDTSVTPPGPPASLVLYYARAGERIFDIARQYNTTCCAIRDANHLTDSVLVAPKALLIPTI